MRIESYLVAEMLQRLEQQSVMLRPHTIEIATALKRDEYLAAREASAELTRVLDAFVTTTTMLQDHVVAHDGLGELGESLGELTLRACGVVLVAQLDLLREALDEPDAGARARGWFTGPLPGIAEIVAYVRQRLTEVHAIWRPYRADQPQLPGMTDTDRATVYRTMIRVAQRTLGELRDEPAFAHFLDHGMSATDLSEVYLACRRIDLVLGLQVDSEAGRVTGRKQRRSRTPNGVPERP